MCRVIPWNKTLINRDRYRGMSGWEPGIHPAAGNVFNRGISDAIKRPFRDSLLLQILHMTPSSPLHYRVICHSDSPTHPVASAPRLPSNSSPPRPMGNLIPTPFQSPFSPAYRELDPVWLSE